MRDLNRWGLLLRRYRRYTMKTFISLLAFDMLFVYYIYLYTCNMEAVILWKPFQEKKKILFAKFIA